MIPDEIHDWKWWFSIAMENSSKASWLTMTTVEIFGRREIYYGDGYTTIVKYWHNKPYFIGRYNRLHD